MKTKVIVLMLWILLGLLFSGCATKGVTYVPIKCTIEKPVKAQQENCREFKSDLDFIKCVARNNIRLKGDYDALSEAFDGCK